MSEHVDHESEKTADNIMVNTEEEQDYRSKQDILLHETVPMLADEEMPSYISVVSRDNYIENTQPTVQQSPLQAKDDLNAYASDQDEDSVYVVSSREGSEHPMYDDEEDGYDDSDDPPNDEDEDDDAEEEDDDEDGEDEEEDDEEDEDAFDGIPSNRFNNMADVYDQGFLKVHDDFILRRHKHLGIDCKQRSLSLQDLSTCKRKSYSSSKLKRRSLNILEEDHTNRPVKTYVYSTSHKKHPSFFKYQHVQSKVKNYIQSMKQQNRQSIEKRLRKTKSPVHTNHSANIDPLSDSPKNTETTEKLIKHYAKDVFRELEIEECEIKKIKDLENGKDITMIEPEVDNTIIDDKQPIPMEVSCGKIKKSNDKIEDCNGIMEIDSEDAIPAMKTSTSLRESRLPNGHESASTFYNMRPLTYEGYMNSSSISMDPSSETLYPLKIANVQSVPMNLDNISQGLRRANPENNQNKSSKMNQISFEMDKKNAEITTLKMQLDQKSVQYDNLKVDYQKTISENLKMKQELESLRKALSKREKENEPRPVKVAAVQTETYIEPEPIKSAKKIPITQKSSNSSLETGSSSIERWPESSIEQITESTSTFIKPPEFEINSNSSSYIAGSPKNLQLSKSFITSSRILQTLASITQNKTNKVESFMSNMTNKDNSRVESTKETREHSNSMTNQSHCSKKRKATEMMEHSNFSQPFKIPHTATGPLRKSFHADDNSLFKHPESLNKSKNTSYVNSGSLKNDQMNESFQSIDLDDNIKFYVYREDENSEEKSFLIQTTEPSRKSNKESRLQECGPYLLGNVEIRMSEVNGLINIWGKEVSSESVLEKQEQIKSCENTPHTSSDRMTCSTLKRPKLTPRFNFDPHSSHNNDIRETSHNSSDMQYPTINCSPNSRVHSSQSMNSSKHKVFSKHSHSSCCDQRVQTSKKDCHCQMMEEKTHNISPICSKLQLNPLGNHKCLGKNYESDNISCSHNPRTEFLNEDVCRHSKYDRSCCQNADDNETHLQCHNHSNEYAHHYSTSMHQGNCTCHNKSSNDDEQTHLLSPNETSETRQRRLSGKRVRGILMDFLKGCGDCRTPDSCLSRDSKSYSHMKKTPHSSNTTPRMKITPSGSCSNKSQNYSNDRCLREYVNHLESELEGVRTEVEKLQSRSDNMLEMLKTLHSLEGN